MVLGVPRGVHRGQPAPGADLDGLAVRQDVNPLSWSRLEASVERVQELSVDLTGRANQAFRVHEVAGASLVHVHRGAGKRPGHVPHAAGMV